MEVNICWPFSQHLLTNIWQWGKYKDEVNFFGRKKKKREKWDVVQWFHHTTGCFPVGLGVLFSQWMDFIVPDGFVEKNDHYFNMFHDFFGEFEEYMETFFYSNNTPEPAEKHNMVKMHHNSTKNEALYPPYGDFQSFYFRKCTIQKILTKYKVYPKNWGSFCEIFSNWISIESYENQTCCWIKGSTCSFNSCSTFFPRTQTPFTWRRYFLW